MNTLPDPWAIAAALLTQIRLILAGKAHLPRTLARKAAALIRSLEATLRRALVLMAAEISIEVDHTKASVKSRAKVTETKSEPRRVTQPGDTSPRAFSLIEPCLNPLSLPSLPGLTGVSLPGDPSDMPAPFPTTRLLARLELAANVFNDRTTHARRLAIWQARQRARRAQRTSPLRDSTLPISKHMSSDLQADLMHLELQVWRRTEGIDSS